MIVRGVLDSMGFIQPSEDSAPSIFVCEQCDTMGFDAQNHKCTGVEIMEFDFESTVYQIIGRHLSSAIEDCDGLIVLKGSQLLPMMADITNEVVNKIIPLQRERYSFEKQLIDKKREAELVWQHSNETNAKLQSLQADFNKAQATIAELEAKLNKLKSPPLKRGRKKAA